MCILGYTLSGDWFIAQSLQFTKHISSSLSFLSVFDIIHLSALVLGPSLLYVSCIIWCEYDSVHTLNKSNIQIKFSFVSPRKLTFNQFQVNFVDV